MGGQLDYWLRALGSSRRTVNVVGAMIFEGLVSGASEIHKPHAGAGRSRDSGRDAHATSTPSLPPRVRSPSRIPFTTFQLKR